MNKVILIGRLARDIDITDFDSGSRVLRNAVAVNRKYNNVEETYFFEIEAWNNTADYIRKYCNKGSKVLVDGELRTQTYLNRDGVNVTKTYIACFKAECLSGFNSDSETSYKGLVSDMKKEDESKLFEKVGKLKEMKEQIRKKRESEELFGDTIEIVDDEIDKYDFKEDYDIGDDDLPF